MAEQTPRDDRLRRYWDRQAGSYDRQMTNLERRYLADTRRWLCEQAAGHTLEVALGTGRNLAHYPDDVQLTGVEWSPAMLAVALREAEALGRQADLRTGDARALEFADASFDTVVATFALCGISDERLALAEMVRVLKPGGLLLLADHVAASAWPVRLVQSMADAVTVPLYGEHWRRRPLRHLPALGLDVEQHQRFSLGIIERVAARKPATGT